MKTVGFIGSGQIGRALARLAIEAGHQVVRRNSRVGDRRTSAVGARVRKSRLRDYIQAGE